MPKHPETVAIIPARGGSKGIPRKNIADLAGKPLIAYSILAALHSKYIDRVIVSTDDDEIAEISKSWGAEVPFLRPSELAQDTSGIGGALSYTISRLGGYIEGRAYAYLYPTSPFRTPDFIDNMLHLLYNGYSSVSTVREVQVDFQFFFIKDENDNKPIKLLREVDQIMDYKKYYREYAVFKGCMPQKKDKHYFYVLENKCMYIDIDTPKDLTLAEAIIRNQLFDFGF